MQRPSEAKAGLILSESSRPFSRLSRRSLFGFVALGLPTLSWASTTYQGGLAGLEPGQGEILLEGKITGGSRKERKMTILVDRVVSPSGTQTPLDPPRSRDVQLSDKTFSLIWETPSKPSSPKG